MIQTDPPTAFASVCVGCCNQGRNQGTTRTVTLDAGAVVIEYRCDQCHATMTERLPREPHPEVLRG